MLLHTQNEKEQKDQSTNVWNNDDDDDYIKAFNSEVIVIEIDLVYRCDCEFAEFKKKRNL